jgi:hypothetical protein
VLWLYALLVIVPVSLWYWHAYRLWEVYGNSFGIFGGWVKQGVWPLIDTRWIFLIKTLLFRLSNEIVTPVGLALLLAGAFLIPARRNFLLQWWAVGFAISIFLVPAGHRAHDYYQLPVLFVTASFMAVAATRMLSQKILPRIGAGALCLLFVVFSCLQLQQLFSISLEHWQRVDFNKSVERLSEPDAPIVFARHRPDGFITAYYQHRTAWGEYLWCDPIDFYISHRKGWSVDALQVTPEFLETLQKRGAKYFATADVRLVFEQNPELKDALERSYTPVEVTRGWVIYRLDNPKVSVVNP